MCGIAGFIGHSKAPNVSFDLINSLMIITEVRGDNATGFWCAGPKSDNRVFYYKEPTKSSEFVKRKIWKDIREVNPDILLGHCRWTSTGMGSEKTNKNNHPHVSTDGRIALVHNGRILEYDWLKKKYKTQSDCDSEVLLRLFESGEEYHDQQEFLKQFFPKEIEGQNPLSTELLSRVWGLREVYSKISVGTMAAAIGERRQGDERTLWLFRNNGRPLTLIDLRPSLGQIFFCSVPEIFRVAWERSKLAKQYITPDQEVTELCADSIFYFNLDSTGKIVHDRWDIRKKRKFGFYEYNQMQGDFEKKLKKTENPLVRSQIEIVSCLDSDDNIIEKTKLKDEEITTATATKSTELVLPRTSSDDDDNSDVVGPNVPFGGVPPGFPSLDTTKTAIPPRLPNTGLDEESALDDDTHNDTTEDSAYKDNESDETEENDIEFQIPERLLRNIKKYKKALVEHIEGMVDRAISMAEKREIPVAEFEELVAELESMSKEIVGTKISFKLGDE